MNHVDYALPSKAELMRERRKDLISGPFGFYARNCLSIRLKSGGVAAFVLNKAQRYVDAALEEQKRKFGYVRALILKGRQQGISTYIQGRFIRTTTCKRGIRAFILTHEDKATNNLFAMGQRFYKNLPAIVQPELGKCNAKELTFANLDSGYDVGTAGKKDVGRSQTIQLFHGSEVAFWPNSEDHGKGILQAIPKLPGTEIILESTANGVGNFFHALFMQAQEGEGNFIAIFVPWFWQDEYRETPPDDFEPTDEEVQLASQFSLSRDQIYWRRMKILEFSASQSDPEIYFKQEYPMDAVEAFQYSAGDTLITSKMCIAARKREVFVEPGSRTIPFVVGVDPSTGVDSFAHVSRYQRKMYNAVAYKGAQVQHHRSRVNICRNILDTECEIAGKKPDMMFIDYSAGLGAAMVDELVSEGYRGRVMAINFGAEADNKEQYKNKRNEMIGRFAEWLRDQDMPAQIPDDDLFQAHLCASPYTWDAHDRMVLRSKDFIKKEFRFSPDFLDAGALTFAKRLDLQALNREVDARPLPVLSSR